MKPKLSLRLSPDCFGFDNRTICTGDQLKQLLLELTATLVWYGADITGLFPSSSILANSEQHCPQRLGNSLRLINLVEDIDQFFSGVFLGMASGDEAGELSLSTEDEEFRDIGNALIEIRAFDTSYFEIYSSDSNLIQRLKQKFGGKVTNFTD